MDIAPLFDLPDTPVITAGEPDKRRPTRKPPDPAKIRWSKYRPAQRVACDDCLAELVAAGGGAGRARRPLATQAARRRPAAVRRAHAAAPARRRASTARRHRRAMRRASC